MTAVVQLRYAVVFVAVALGVAVLVSIVNAQASTTLGSSAQLMVPAMIAAVVEGGLFARSHRRKPSASEAWGFSWVGMLTAALLNVALAYGAGGIAPEFGKLAIAEPFSRQFLILLGLYAGGYLIFNRLFFGIGAGNQLSLIKSREGEE